MASSLVDGETAAINFERFIKKQKSRKLSRQLVDPGFVVMGFLAQLVRVPHLRGSLVQSPSRLSGIQQGELLLIKSLLAIKAETLVN